VHRFWHQRSNLISVFGAQVSRCTKIIQGGKDETGKDELKYLINCKQHGKYVVDLGEKVSPTDIEEGMRIGYVFHSVSCLRVTRLC
jgi:ATP-dependent 26S proteasome regulatory subunit